MPDLLPRRRLAFSLVLLVLAASFVATPLAGFRAGGYLLAAALLLAGSLRALLPAPYCLGLLVRSRRVDVGMSLLLAAAVLVLARAVPG